MKTTISSTPFFSSCRYYGRISSLAIMSCLIVACSSAEKRDIDTDTVKPQELSADTVAEVRKVYVLSSEGVGPIEVGEKTGSWPEEVDELYNHVEASPGDEADQYEFYLDDNPMVTVLDFGSGSADLVVLSSPDVKVAMPGPDGENIEIGLGDSFRHLLSSPEVKAEWQQLDDEGMWYWHGKGLWFAPAQDRLPKELADKLYNPDTPPRSSDFPDDVVVDYIATGLPF